MHYDLPPEDKQHSVDKPKQEENETKIIMKAALVAAFATGMVSIIYFAMRDNPGSFSIVAPVQSQPDPKPEPVKVLPPTIY